MNKPRLSGVQPYRKTLGRYRSAFTGALVFLAAFPVAAATFPDTAIADLPIEELANIRITSVSKRPEPLSDAAASVFVISADDIRRAGATTLPEAMRLAPNLHVTRDSSDAWFISARGYNGSKNSAPNKLLVLIDGRSVYSPMFAGVFWEVQDVMLEDIDRIEVISGPAGTLWGLNAVNGVINIITRSAAETQGTLVVASVGNQGAETGFRHGAPIGGDGYLRVYGKYFKRKNTFTEDGRLVDDRLYKNQIGFRADWDRPDDQVSVQGNAYSARIGQPQPGQIFIAYPGFDRLLRDITASGANLMGRWTHALADGSNFVLQGYYDRTKRTVPPTFGETLDILDMEFQHTLQPLGMHTVVWGVNYRYGRDQARNSFFSAFLPKERNLFWASLFAQDDITLNDALKLTIGARIERNNYSKTDFLPSARLAWKISPDHLLWTAASRAARGATRLDTDFYLPGRESFNRETDVQFGLLGGPGVGSEHANVFEIGYRAQLATNFSYSITAFHTLYNDLRTEEISSDLSHAIFSDGMKGTATGVEMWGAYRVTPRWRISAGFTALKERFRLKPTSVDVDQPNSVAGKDPANTWQVRSSFHIAENRDLDISLRHVASLSDMDVPAYTAVDARFAWKLQRDLELSITGLNLLGTAHVEYGNVEFRGKIPREVILKLIWRI
ncbi:MAG: TonB-dependent receptor [Herminiimonas sp.]|nr:TonB-dependent receptor [Herminiimonas sp.]